MMPCDAIEKIELGISFRLLLLRYSLFALLLDFFIDIFADFFAARHSNSHFLGISSFECVVLDLLNLHQQIIEGWPAPHIGKRLTGYFVGVLLVQSIFFPPNR